MGEKRKRRPAEEDSLRWYEVLTCCCKWRAECRSCVATTCIYFVPIVFLLCLTAASIVIGVLWRTSCDYNPRVPYWVLLSSVTPYPLLVFIKAVKEKYQGITFWRATSLTYYVMFAAWMVIGSIWVYDTWGQACDDCCNHYLKTYALVLTCVHWLLLVLATVPQIYILAWTNGAMSSFFFYNLVWAIFKNGTYVVLEENQRFLLKTGSIWVYDTWGQACDDCCNHYLKTYALVLTCVHWLLLVLATVPQIHILAWVCCCLTDPATHPLKPGTALDNYPM